MSSEDSGSPVRLSSKIRFRAVAGEGVLVHLERGQVMVVTEVGLDVVRVLERGPANVADLVQEVVKNYEVEVDQARRDVCFFLDQLRGEMAIEDVAAQAEEVVGK